jgi:hypothetical protein
MAAGMFVLVMPIAVGVFMGMSGSLVTVLMAVVAVRLRFVLVLMLMLVLIMAAHGLFLLSRRFLAFSKSIHMIELELYCNHRPSFGQADPWFHCNDRHNL